MATDEQQQKHHQEFQERFRKMSDVQLIDAFNSDVGKPVWISARAIFHATLREEFKKRNYDFSAIGGIEGISLNKRMRLIGKKIMTE